LDTASNDALGIKLPSSPSAFTAAALPLLVDPLLDAEIVSPPKNTDPFCLTVNFVIPAADAVNIS